MVDFPFTCPDCGGSSIEIAAMQKLYFRDGKFCEAGDANWDGSAPADCCDCDWIGYADELNEDGVETERVDDDEASDDGPDVA